MEKITKSSDKVLIDPNEPLILPDGTALVGRVEWFLYALCCLDYQNLPTPMSRIEEFANALITGEIPNIQPQSRAEQFFLAILDGNISDLPQPQSRSEVLLDKLARGEFDLSDVEPIQSSYELLLAYLIKNGGIGNIDYVLYEFSEAMKTMYNTVEKPFKSLELSGNTLVNCVLEDTENDDYTSFDEDYSGTSFTINGTSEGAIKSAILKGQTLVNISSLSGEIAIKPNSNRFIESSLIQQNKTFTFMFNCTSVPSTGFIEFRQMLDNTALKIENINVVQGYNKFKVTTVNKELNRFRLKNDSTSETDFVFNNLLIIEGDYTNIDIPYFEGMQSVKLPVLTTTGKNLFNGKITRGGIEVTTGVATPNESSSWCFTDYIDVNNITSLCFQTGYMGQNNVVYVCYDIDKNYLGYKGFYNGLTGSIIPIENTHYIRLRLPYDIDVSTTQIEQGKVATNYEPYKSNILSCNEEVELRGIGEVKDELNLLTGEVTQRIGEIVLDGSEKWEIREFNTTNTECVIFTISIDDKLNSWYFNCDKFNYYNVDVILANNIEGIYTGGKPNNLFINVSKTKANTVEDFKNWLSNNNVTVQYQSIESIKTVDLNVVDQNNTKIDTIHVFDEVTHVNTSSDELTPTVNIDKSVSYPTIIKPNTKYTVDLKRNDRPLTINLGGTEVTFTDGETRKTITTPSTLVNDKLSYYGIGAKCNEIMLIEGEIERNIDYFTGMQSVVMQNQMPILSTVGKNLLYKHNDIGNTYGISQFHNGGFTTREMGRYGTFGCIKSLNNPSQAQLDKNPTSVQKGKTYTISCEVKKISGISTKLNYLRFVGYNNEGDSYSWTNMGWNSGELDYDYNNTVKLTKTVVCDCSYKYITVAGQVSNDSSGAVFKITNIQLEESLSATAYEDYKTSILSCNEEVTLRGIGDVKDTLDGNTGELTERVGEFIVHCKLGVEGCLRFGTTDIRDDYIRMVCTNTFGKVKKNSKFLNNKFDTVSCMAEDYIYIFVRGELRDRIYADTSAQIVQNFMDLLNEWHDNDKPLIIQYEKKSEQIKTVDLSVVDQDENMIPKIKSYKDVTHLEVTVPKQSLLPHISAEVATDNSKDMSLLTAKHQEINEAQSAIEDNIQSQSDEIDTALMATTEIFESILE